MGDGSPQSLASTESAPYTSSGLANGKGSEVSLVKMGGCPNEALGPAPKEQEIEMSAGGTLPSKSAVLDCTCLCVRASEFGRAAITWFWAWCEPKIRNSNLAVQRRERGEDDGKRAGGSEVGDPWMENDDAVGPPPLALSGTPPLLCLLEC